MIHIETIPMRANDDHDKHYRLQLAVVEAAKEWKACDNDDEAQKWGNHYKVMCEAIDALITFEAEQKNGNT